LDWIIEDIPDLLRDTGNRMTLAVPLLREGYMHVPCGLRYGGVLDGLLLVVPKTLWRIRADGMWHPYPVVTWVEEPFLPLFPPTALPQTRTLALDIETGALTFTHSREIPDVTLFQEAKSAGLYVELIE
jgi:hypothetical protein